MLDQMGAIRSAFEERMRSELGFVHGELRNIHVALEDDESDEQPAAESVVSSEGERGNLDDPLHQAMGSRVALHRPLCSSNLRRPQPGA